MTLKRLEDIENGLTLLADSARHHRAPLLAWLNSYGNVPNGSEATSTCGQHRYVFERVNGRWRYVGHQ